MYETEMDFSEWMENVNSEMLNLVGVGVDDLPDGPWMDYFEDGCSPQDAITEYQDGGWDDGMMP